MFWFMFSVWFHHYPGWFNNFDEYNALTWDYARYMQRLPMAKLNMISDAYGYGR